MVFHHVSSRSTRVVFKLKGLRLCCPIYPFIFKIGSYLINGWLNLIFLLCNVMSMLDYYKLILSSSFVCNSDQLLSCTLFFFLFSLFLSYLSFVHFRFLLSFFFIWKGHADEGTHYPLMSNHKANEKRTKMVNHKNGDEITESHNAKSF